MFQELFTEDDLVGLCEMADAAGIPFHFDHDVMVEASPSAPAPTATHGKAGPTTKKKGGAGRTHLEPPYGVADGVAVRQALDHGFTLSLLQPQRVQDATWLLAARLERALGVLVDVEATVTPPGQTTTPRGLPVMVPGHVHWLLCQTEGSQSVQIWHTGSGSGSEASDDDNDELNQEPDETVTLAVGDVLYVPPGYAVAGQARGKKSTSSHLVLQVDRQSVGDLAMGVMMSAMGTSQGQMADGWESRMNIVPSACSDLRSGGTIQAEAVKVAAVFQELANLVKCDVGTPAKGSFVSEAKEQLMTDFMERRLPPHPDMAADVDVDAPTFYNRAPDASAVMRLRYGPGMACVVDVDTEEYLGDGEDDLSEGEGDMAMDASQVEMIRVLHCLANDREAHMRMAGDGDDHSDLEDDEFDSDLSTGSDSDSESEEEVDRWVQDTLTQKGEEGSDDDSDPTPGVGTEDESEPSAESEDLESDELRALEEIAGRKVNLNDDDDDDDDEDEDKEEEGDEDEDEDDMEGQEEFLDMLRASDSSDESTLEDDDEGEEDLEELDDDDETYPLFPAQWRYAIQQILSTPGELAVQDIPLESEEERVFLAGELWRVGLLERIDDHQESSDDDSDDDDDDDTHGDDHGDDDSGEDDFVMAEEDESDEGGLATDLPKDEDVGGLEDGAYVDITTLRALGGKGKTAVPQVTSKGKGNEGNEGKGKGKGTGKGKAVAEPNVASRMTKAKGGVQKKSTRGPEKKKK